MWKRGLRNHRPVAEPNELPLLAMPQAAWRGVPQPRSGRGDRFPLPARRAPGQVLRKPARLSARLLRRLRLADPQSCRTTMAGARRLPGRPAAIWCCAGAARQPGRQAAVALLRGQQGGVVRPRRRPAAISGLSAAGVTPCGWRRRDRGGRDAGGRGLGEAQLHGRVSEAGAGAGRPEAAAGRSGRVT